MSIEISSWLTEIAQALHNATAGIFGNVPTANIFLQQLPDSPVLAIGVYATGGSNDPIGIDPLSNLNLQVQVRRTKPIDGLRYATQVFNILDNTWNITPSFNSRIIGDHMPGPFYFDAAGCPVYTLNFSVRMGVK